MFGDTASLPACETCGAAFHVVPETRWNVPFGDASRHNFHTVANCAHGTEEACGSGWKGCVA
jgi:hypothetical protein